MGPKFPAEFELSGVDDPLEPSYEELRPTKVYNLALRRDKPAFLKEIEDLVRDGAINDWFESLCHIMSLPARDYHDDYLEPMFKTENHDRKFLLLLSATESAGSQTPGSNQVLARKIALTLLGNTPNLAWHGDNGMTALHAAAKSGVGNILRRMVELLSCADKLGHALNQLWQSKTPLETAVSYGHLSAVKLLIERDQDLKTRCSVLSLAIEKKHEEIFTEILTMCQDLLEMDRGILRKIVEKDAAKAWSAATQVKSFPSLLANSCDLLHAAVEHRRLSIVENILELEPHLVAKKDSGERSVLFYNAPSTEDNGPIKSIKHSMRSALAPVIVREMDPASARDMFIEANNPLDEITLNLSIFDKPAHNFANFLDAIDKEKTRNLIPMCSKITFESTLRYLGFPDFDRIEDEPIHAAFVTHSVLPERNVKYRRWQDEPAQETHTSRTIRRDYVAKVLDWLYKIKNVRNIYHLYVPDSLDNPHPEEVIEKAIKPFRIEVLDWRRVDLSIDSIVDSAPTVRELYLYSSGNKAALSHWFGIQGLRKLTKLMKLEVVIYKVGHQVTILNAVSALSHSKHNLSEARAKTLEKFTMLDLELLKAEKPGLEASVRLANWNWKRTSIHSESAGEKSNQLPFELTGLRSFLDFYRSFQRSRIDHDNSALQPVRVAVIDNGVDDYSFNRKIKRGISFVYSDGKEQNWFIASDPHGTQMAKFIQQIDPFCEIYPIKVGDHTRDISSSRVVEAINHAVKDGVHIISMSLALSTSSEKLREAINNATSKNVLVFCSTADNYKHYATVWPAAYDECLSIACRERARSAPEGSSDAKATYQFQGGAFATDEICYIENETHEHTVQGSSVATAIAAGVASLTLACGRYANNNHIIAPKMFIGDMFARMTGGDVRSKFIQPDKFFPSEVLDQEQGEEFIKRNFVEERKVKTSRYW